MLQLSAFTKKDLYELTKSRIYELRSSAAANLTDLSLLADIAKNDKNEHVCRAAEIRLAELKKK